MSYQKGISLALATAVFSGFAIFLNGFVVKAVGDPLVFTTVKNLGVALIIGWLLVMKSSQGRINWKSIRRSDWFWLVSIGIIGGSLPFYLFFKGLALADSGSAALIHKTLVSDLKSIRRSDWFWLVSIGIIGGSLPFYLFFKGLALADSGSAALIHKTLV